MDNITEAVKNLQQAIVTASSQEAIRIDTDETRPIDDLDLDFGQYQQSRA